MVNVIITALIITAVLITVIVIMSGHMKKQKKRIKELEAALEATSMYLKDLVVIKEDKNDKASQIMEAETDEEVFTILDSIINHNNSKLQNK